MPKAKWSFVNIHRDEVKENIHHNPSLSRIIRGSWNMFQHPWRSLHSRWIATRMATRVGTFDVCVHAHAALRMFGMQVLASQLHFLVNKNTELVVLPLFWPVNCIKTGALFYALFEHPCQRHWYMNKPMRCIVDLA